MIFPITYIFSGIKCSNNTICGSDPKVVPMSENDAEVVCGEWKTGPESWSSSGENYNLIFNIEVDK